MSKIEKKDKKVRKKSNCWLFYTKTDRGGVCRLCKKEIISHGNTTNLLNHLKRKHTNQWEAATEGIENEEDSHMEIEMDEDKDDDCNHFIKSPTENHHSLAYQSSDGRTVIWLHPDVQMDQLSSGFQPQITLVEHSSESGVAEEATVLESGEVVQKEGTTVLSLGEIIQKEDDGTLSSEMAQKVDSSTADVLQKEGDIILETGEVVQEAETIILGAGDVIQNEDVTNSNQVAQIVTVTTSVDSFLKKNPVATSPSKMILGIPTSSTTTAPSPPQKKIVVTRVAPSSQKRMMHPEPTQGIPRKLVEQSVASRNVVSNKADRKKKEKHKKATSRVAQKNADNNVKQNNASSRVAQNNADSNVKQNNATSRVAQTNADSNVKQNNATSYVTQNNARCCVAQTNGTCCQGQREDSFDQFGKYIATLLRNLPSRKSASRLQKEMLNWVLKEQMLYED